MIDRDGDYYIITATSPYGKEITIKIHWEDTMDEWKKAFKTIEKWLCD